MSFFASRSCTGKNSAECFKAEIAAWEVEPSSYLALAVARPVAKPGSVLLPHQVAQALG